VRKVSCKAGKKIGPNDATRRSHPEKENAMGKKEDEDASVRSGTARVEKAEQPLRKSEATLENDSAGSGQDTKPPKGGFTVLARPGKK
jgi:hypothetical protein